METSGSVGEAAECPESALSAGGKDLILPSLNLELKADDSKL